MKKFCIYQGNLKFGSWGNLKFGSWGNLKFGSWGRCGKDGNIEYGL